MVTIEQLNLLIDAAASIAGSQAKLAALLGIPKNHITEMKKDRRPCNWRTRGKLRAILGEDPAYALMDEMRTELEQSDNADELKAAATFQTILAAYPNGAAQKENPASLSTGGVVWRKRRDSNPR